VFEALLDLLCEYSIDLTNEITVPMMKNRSYSKAISKLHSRGHRFDHDFIVLLAKAGKIESIKWLQKNGYQIRWRDCLYELRKSFQERYDLDSPEITIPFLENELKKEEMWRVWSRYNGENDHQSHLDWPPEEVMKDIVEFLEE
jgi:hypothetical protein